jgi:MFS family permease
LQSSISNPTESSRNPGSFFLTLLPLFVLAHFAHHLLTALPVPLLPMIRDDFGLSYTRCALVTSAFSLAYGVGQLPAGWLSDRIGPRGLITVGILGVAVAGILVGLSTTFWMMIAFLIVMGLVGGGYHPAAAPLISASVAPKVRGRALGVHLIGGSASFFLAPIIAVNIASFWGWRGSFISLALPTALLGLMFYALLTQKRISRHSDAVAAGRAEASAPAPGNRRRLIAFLILTVIGGGAGFSITGFIPLYLVDHFGISEKIAGSMIAITYSAGLWAGPLGGYLSDRLGRVPLVIGTGIFGGILVLLLKVMPFGLGFGDLFFINGLGIGVLLLFIGFNSFVRMPVSEAYIMEQTHAHRRSTVYGIYYFAMQQAGGIFAPLVGLVVDHYGFQACFTLSGVIMISVTLACSYFLVGERRHAGQIKSYSKI